MVYMRFWKTGLCMEYCLQSTAPYDKPGGPHSPHHCNKPHKHGNIQTVQHLAIVLMPMLAPLLMVHKSQLGSTRAGGKTLNQIGKQTGCTASSQRYVSTLLVNQHNMLGVGMQSGRVSRPLVSNYRLECLREDRAQIWCQPRRVCQHTACHMQPPQTHQNVFLVY
jgi:hypothetical protein